MPHLSELHGASTHLAVVAIPLYALLLVLARTRLRHAAITAAEPWVLAAAVAGMALAGVTGLLVHGQAETGLRGGEGTIGTVHFWLGFVLAALVLGPAVARLAALRSSFRTAPGVPVLAALLALGAVAAQGYLGGRMTYEHGVGVEAGGGLAQTARGTADLEVALAAGTSMVSAGKAAFAAQGLGCASCHGGLAQGARGPALAGGRDVREFRRVHAHGLFPPSVVTDRDFAAIDAYLASLPATGPRD